MLRPDIFAEDPRITAGFSTRKGGVSPAPYDTLNLGTTTDDDPENVAINRRRFCRSLNASPDQIAEAGQVHGNTVRVVTEPGWVETCDGLVTNTPGVLLCIGTADCAAVLLADSDAGVVGACHSGWRGTVANIAAKTVDAMVDLGASPNRIVGYVSPCISLDAFEVGPEVAKQFDPAYVHRREDWKRPHVDLQAVLQDQICETGVPSRRVSVSPYCTVENNDDFYSYRAGNGVTGRMLGAVGLTLRA